MRFAPVAIASILLSFTASAQVVREEPALQRAESLPGEAKTVGERLDRMSRVHSSVVSVDQTDTSFLIPIAGNTAGGGGTYFRSDVVISNSRSVSQRISVAWLAAGVDSRNATLVPFNIPANTAIPTDDFVRVALSKTGLGAILVFGDTANGGDDLQAELDGYSRIWTPQPGSANGTVSQNFEAIAITDLAGSDMARIIGLKQSGSFRANVGIVNLDASQHTWTVRSVATGATMTITVPADSVVQTALAAGFGNAQGAVGVTLTTPGNGFFWSAYGSSTDNTTGDGWVARAKQ